MLLPNFVDTLPDDLILFEPIRQSAKEVIEIVAPNASVYPYWELEFDPQTLQRKVTPLLRGINADAEILHSWMLGITQGDTVKGMSGAEEFVGGYAYTWNLTMEFEGFFDLKADDPWTVAENEMLKITAIFFINMQRIMRNVKFNTIRWPSIDLESFADGQSLIVVQGNCQIEVEQMFAVV